MCVCVCVCEDTDRRGRGGTRAAPAARDAPTPPGSSRCRCRARPAEPSTASARETRASSKRKNTHKSETSTLNRTCSHADTKVILAVNSPSLKAKFQHQQPKQMRNTKLDPEFEHARRSNTIKHKQVKKFFEAHKLSHTILLEKHVTNEYMFSAVNFLSMPRDAEEGGRKSRPYQYGHGIDCHRSAN